MDLFVSVLFCEKVVFHLFIVFFFFNCLRFPFAYRENNFSWVLMKNIYTKNGIKAMYAAVQVLLEKRCKFM